MPDLERILQIRIRVQDEDEAQRAVERLARALDDLDAKVEIVGAEGVQLGKEQKDLGEKVVGVTEKIVATIAVHEAWHLAKGQLIRASRALAASSTELGTAVGALTARIGTAQTTITTFTRTAIAGLRAGIIGVAVAISARLLVGLGQWLDKMGAAGAATAVTAQGFNNLARSIGETGESLERKLRVATLGTVNDLKLMRVGTTAMLTEVAKSGAELEELARLATILALAVGKDAAEGFDILTTGTARHSTMLLKSLGIVVEANTAYREYADNLGITVEALTDAQRAEAFKNEVMEVARHNVERLSIETDNLAVLNQQAATAADNLRLAFQREVAESEQLLEFKRKLLGLTIELQAETQKLAPLIGLLADSFGFLENAVFDVLAEGRQMHEVLVENTLALGDQETQLGALIRATNQYGGILGIVAGGYQTATAAAAAYVAELEKLEKHAERAPTGPPYLGLLGLLPGMEFPAPQAMPWPRAARVAPLVTDELGQMAPQGPAMRALAERMTDIMTESQADFNARIRTMFEDELVPALEVLRDRVTMGSAEIRALAQEFIALDLSTTGVVERLREMGATEADIMRVLNALDELGEETNENVRAMARQWSAAIAGMVEATFEGASGIEIAFAGLIRALARQLETTISEALGGGLKGGLLGGLVGGFAGFILGSIVKGISGGGHSRFEPVPVTVTNRVRLDRSDEPDPVVVVQITDPVSGRVLEEFVVEAGRLSSRGGAIRLPRPFPLP